MYITHTYIKLKHFPAIVCAYKIERCVFSPCYKYCWFDPCNRISPCPWLVWNTQRPTCLCPQVLGLKVWATMSH